MAAPMVKPHTGRGIFSDYPELHIDPRRRRTGNKARREKRREYALILHLQSSLLNQAGRIFADRPHLAIALLEPEGIVPVLIEDYFP